MWRRTRRKDADFAEEIQAHIVLETDRLIDEGVNPDEARAIGQRRFGNTLAARERFYESRRWPWLDQLSTDLSHAARSVTKYPFSCVIAVVSLAAGIGAATVTLMVRQAVFLSPPPLYADPERLSTVGMAVPDRFPAPVPADLFKLWAEDAQLASSVAAARGSRTVDARMADRLEPVFVRSVSPNLFSILGVTAGLGRTFDPQPTDGGGPTPVVLSHRAWRNFFDSREDVIGSTVWLDEVPHAVIGVMPERFWFLAMGGATFWTPLDVRTLAPTDTVSVVARRNPGVTELELGERLQPSVARYAESLPPEQRRLRAVVAGIEGTPIGRAIGAEPLVLLGTSVLLTLLIGCTNVAMLLIAQWTTREHEIAIRASLGASRMRIVRALIVESTLIALAGGALGTSVTLALRAFLLGGDDAIQFDLSIDYGILASTAAITALVGILTGLAPALYETRLLHANPLRHMRLSDRVRQRWRHALVVFEIAVTVALLVVAGALVSASQRMMSTRLGFDTHAIGAVRVDNAGRVSVPAVLDRLASLPGVARVAAASHVPVAAPPPSQAIALDQSGLAEMRAERALISPTYFETLGVALHAGRHFADQDDAHGVRVTIVNDSLAERLWPGRNPIGEYVWSDNVAHQVVGVVRAYSNTALRAPLPAFYVPIAQGAVANRLHFVIRTEGNPLTLLGTLRRETRDVVPAEANASTFTIDEILDIGGREILVGTFPMMPLIATGLLLTSAGIFSVLAFAVARRSNELAVRIAIGADRRDLLRMVSVQSARLVGLGTLLGITTTFGVTRLAQGSGSVFDAPGWLAFVMPIAVVFVVGACATWIPLRRTLAINPATLLRAS